MATKRTADDEFRDYCLELLSGMRQGEIVARKMFGGTGFSTDGKTFAIIAFEQLWLKVDDETRPAFEAVKSKVFTYDMAGQPKTMNYYTVPDDAMESAALMRPWAMLAWQAALRAAAAKAKKVPKKTATETATKATKTATLAGRLKKKTTTKVAAKPATKPSAKPASKPSVKKKKA
jgi:DNA transformation protein and related proteins